MPRRKTEPATEAVPQTPSTTTPSVSPVTQTTEITRLEGAALLDLQKQMIGEPMNKVAHQAGYFTVKVNEETGEERIQYQHKQLMAALLQAQGITMAPPTRPYSSRSNRAPVVTVGGNGNIVVGNRYSSVAGFDPGAKIQVTATTGKIVLTVAAVEPAQAETEIEAGAEEDSLDDL